MRWVLAFVIAAFAVSVLLLAGGSTDTDATSTTTVVRWGPYNVPGGSPGQLETLSFNVAQPCSDCFITSVVPNLVYEDGTTANLGNMAMMHHVVVASSPGTDSTCAGTTLGSLGERLFASGNERTVLSLPYGYGLYNPPGQQWHLIMHLMNMMPEARDLYFEFTFTYRSGSDDVRPVTPVWLDVDNCADSEIAIPAGYSDTHWDWTPDITGDLIAIAGHIHDYGISDSLESLVTGENICTSVAGYSDGSAYAPAPVADGGDGHPAASVEANPSDPLYAGHIEYMSGCTPMFRLNAGETIRLHARYNAPAPVDNAMGIMMAFVYETGDPPDWDADGVPNSTDNCPAWPNANQLLPAWPVVANDPDCDGFGWDAEAAMGTWAVTQCGQTTTANDEGSDAWPVDFDDNANVNISDVLALKPVFGQTVPPALPRFDLVEDNNITISDVLALKPFFGESCQVTG